MQIDAFADIVHYFTHPDTGDDTYDEFGEPKLGYYWRIIDLKGKPISAEYGPYNSHNEAVEACVNAFHEKDY